MKRGVLLWVDSEQADAFVAAVKNDKEIVVFPGPNLLPLVVPVSGVVDNTDEAEVAECVRSIVDYPDKDPAWYINRLAELTGARWEGDGRQPYPSRDHGQEKPR